MKFDLYCIHSRFDDKLGNSARVVRRPKHVCPNQEPLNIMTHDLDDFDISCQWARWHTNGRVSDKPLCLPRHQRAQAHNSTHAVVSSVLCTGYVLNKTGSCVLKVDFHVRTNPSYSLPYRLHFSTTYTMYVAYARKVKPGKSSRHFFHSDPPRILSPRLPEPSSGSKCKQL
jgi:hypothetical protein